jgi:NAD-dependent deacetylase
MDGTGDRGAGRTPALTAAFAEATDRLAAARRIVIFTGAGVSTDSGIPDFRSPGGLWDRYDPRQLSYRRYLEDPAVRRLAWRMRRELHAMRPRPNAAHLACTRLAEAGRLAGVVTQNIDGLHGDAGLDPDLVCELHGNSRWVACLSCRDRRPMEEAIARLEAGEEDPACLRCGGILKSTTVSFGQALPRQAWERAEAMVTTCDGFVAAGSSLVVYPAASLPELARSCGATVLIINREPTPLDPLADLVLRGECGELLPRLVSGLLEAA